MAICSLSTLKEYLPELAGTTGADAQLTSLIDRVESVISRYLGFSIPDGTANPVLTEATYTMYVDGPTSYDEYTLQLPLAPISSITSIHADIDRQYGSSTLIDATKYTFNSTLGRVYLDPNTATVLFRNGYRANKVVAVCGWNAVTAPDDLEHAIAVWASQLHRNKSNQGKEQITQSNGTVRISPKTMPYEIKEYLGKMKCPSLVF